MIKADLLKILRDRSLKQAPPGKPFILASGKESMTYLDVRQTALSPQGHMILGEMLYTDVIKLPDVEGVAGVELGGCPLASAASMYSAYAGVLALKYMPIKPVRQLEALYVRKSAKEHGAKNLVEGAKRPGMKVVLLEDVVTSGGSSLRAIETLKEEKLEVVSVIAVVDREQGGAAAFGSINMPFSSLTTMKEILG